MFPYFWEAQNHFPWVKNEVQNMLNFESLSFYIRLQRFNICLTLIFITSLIIIIVFNYLFAYDLL